MDQEGLAKARGWKCLPQDLRMLGKGPFLGAIMSKFYASSPSNSEIPQEMLPLHWKPDDSAASEKLIKSHALRERRCWGRIGLGPYPSLYTGKNILLSRAGDGDSSRHFLNGWLVWCCHLLGSRPLLYCSDPSILFIQVCVWMLSPSLVV